MEALILSLLLKHAAVNAVPAPKLVKEIFIVSKQYKVSPLVLAKIIMVESKGNAAAINYRTHDYGLMQIHDSTAELYGFDKKCLLDWKCNLRAGTRILADVTRVCRYNVGTGVLKGDRLEKCLQYEAKLDRIK